MLETGCRTRPLDAALRGLPRQPRSRHAAPRVSRRYCERHQQVQSWLHRSGSTMSVPTTCIVLTTRLAKTHGRIVVEGLMRRERHMRQSGNRQKAHARTVCDAALGKLLRRHQSVPRSWKTNSLVVADRWSLSNSVPPLCRYVQDIGCSRRYESPPPDHAPTTTTPRSTRTLREPLQRRLAQLAAVM